MWCPPGVTLCAVIETVDISQKIFAEHDEDGSGTMDMTELRNALSKQGTIVSAIILVFKCCSVINLVGFQGKAQLTACRV